MDATVTRWGSVSFRFPELGRWVFVGTLRERTIYGTDTLISNGSSDYGPFQAVRQ